MWGESAPSYYRPFVLYMIGFVIQTFAGIACSIDYVRPWGFSLCSVIPVTVFRSYHTTSGGLQAGVTGSIRACYKFFVLYMIGFVIQTFAGIGCPIDSGWPWGFSLRSVIPFIVVRIYHTGYKFFVLSMIGPAIQIIF